jgi:ferric iron reductase protein FhuF
VIPSLASLFIGDLAPYAGTLVLADDPRPAIPGPELMNPGTLDTLMIAAAAHLGEGDRRALMSLWCIEYVHVLMPVVVVATLLLNRQLPLALADIALILDEEEIPGAIRLPDEGCVSQTDDPFVNFSTLIRSNLEPLFDAWAAYSGVSQRVLWTNAANLFEAILRGLQRLPNVPPEALAPAERLVTDSHWPDGRRNPFRQPVIYRPDHPTTHRWRRVCCVRYLIPRYDYCSNCPHLLAAWSASYASGGA